MYPTKFIPHLLIIISTTYLYFLTDFIPLLADDLCRYEPNFNLSRIINNVIISYQKATGRVPAMFLNFTLFSSGKIGTTLIALGNSFAFLIFSYITLKLIPLKNWRHQLIFLAIYLYLFWFTPDSLGEDILWKTGTIQYFWSTVLAISCLSPVIKLTLYHHTTTSKILLPLYTVGTLLGGMWLEHLSVAIFIAWASLLSYRYFIDKNPIPTIYWIGLIFWGIGLAILLAAPGNYLRMSEDAISYGNPTTLDKIIRLSPFIIDNLGKKLIAIYLILLISSLILKPKDIKKRLLHSLIFISIGLLIALATVGAPTMVFWHRVTFPSELFYILGTLVLFPYNLEKKKQPLTTILTTFFALFAITLTTHLTIDTHNTWHTYQSIHQQEQYRQKLIAEAHNNGITHLKLPPYQFPDGSSTLQGEINHGRKFARDIGDKKSHWSKCYARIHGIDSVTL